MKANFKQILFLFCLMSIGVALLTSNVYAQTPGDSPPGHETRKEKIKARMLEIFKQLDLSAEQQKQLEAHRNKHRGQSKEIRKNIKAKKEEIRNELQKQDLNMEKVYEIHSELKALRSERADHRLKGILGVRKILTIEQFVKFRELKKDLHSKEKRKQGCD